MEDHYNVDITEHLSASGSHINYTGLIPVFILLVVVVARISFEVYKNRRQKTRIPQERRQHVGSRARQSFSQPDPMIYVSPANLPPPPKYEAMAPPSYEEVVGIHYPNYPASIQTQPITQPIAIAMAQNPANNATSNVNNEPTTIVTVTADERRTSVTVATS